LIIKFIDPTNYNKKATYLTVAFFTFYEDDYLDQK